EAAVVDRHGMDHVGELAADAPGRAPFVDVAAVVVADHVEAALEGSDPEEAAAGAPAPPGFPKRRPPATGNPAGNTPPGRGPPPKHSSRWRRRGRRWAPPPAPHRASERARPARSPPSDPPRRSGRRGTSPPHGWRLWCRHRDAHRTP